MKLLLHFFYYLKEIGTEQFAIFFLPELKKNGYDGIFNPKSRAKTMSEEDGKYVDGCAIFWKTSKYKRFSITLFVIILDFQLTSKPTLPYCLFITTNSKEYKIV